MKIAVMPGDGVGKEVIAQGIRLLDVASKKFGFKYGTTDYPFGGEHYLKTETTLPDSALREIAQHDAILFGALVATHSATPSVRAIRTLRANSEVEVSSRGFFTARTLDAGFAGATSALVQEPSLFNSAS